MNRTLLLTVVLLVSLCGVAAAQEIAVIVNKDNPVTMDRTMISRVFLGSITKWQGGGNITVLELNEATALNEEFAQKVVGRSPQSLKDHWSALVFTGKSAPPRQFPSEDELMKAVAKNKNAIGYINAAKLDDSVRMVYKTR